MEPTITESDLLLQFESTPAAVERRCIAAAFLVGGAALITSALFGAAEPDDLGYYPFSWQVVTVWAGVALMCVYLTRARTPLVGVVAFAPLVSAIVVREGSIGKAALAGAAGLFVGRVGSRGASSFPVTTRGARVLTATVLLSALLAAPASHVTASEAGLSVMPDDVGAIAVLVEGSQGWVLAPSNTFHGRGASSTSSVRSLSIATVRRQGFSWYPAGPGEVRRSRDIRGEAVGFAPKRGAPAYINFGHPDSPGYVDVPEACVSPLITGVPYDELMYNCWIAEDSLYVVVAPTRASRIEIIKSGRVETRRLNTQGAADGLIFSTTGESVLRFAFRDSRNQLLDAVPSMVQSVGWYPVVAAAAGAKCLDAGSCFGSDSERRGYRAATVSLTLLRPAEYSAYCKGQPPAGDFVLIGRVKRKSGVFFDWSLERGSREAWEREVLAAVNRSGPSLKLDESTLRVQQGIGCSVPVI